MIVLLLLGSTKCTQMPPVSQHYQSGGFFVPHHNISMPMTSSVPGQYLISHPSTNLIGAPSSAGLTSTAIQHNMQHIMGLI